MNKQIISKEIKPLVRKEDSIILFHPDKANKEDYYQQEIKKLHKTIEDKDKTIKHYKDLLNKFLDERDELKYLRQFREKLSLLCILNNNKITIFQCSHLIKTGKCNFYEKCKPRNIIKNLLNF